MDATGNVLNANDHYPFGKRMPTRYMVTDAEGNRYQYTGHEFDEETGYGYHGARYYNRELGKYMNVDPLAENYFAWSSYNYTMGNPINLIDPTGMGPTTHIVNSSTGDSHFLDDGSDDIVVMGSDDYLQTVLNGMSYEMTSKIDEDFEGKAEILEMQKNAYEENLIKGVRHTSTDFSTGNASADKNILSLDPRARIPMILSVIQARAEGLDVRGAGQGGFRTYAEQDALYAKGRTAAGNVVTNAKGGQSNHNFGLSMDVAIFENGKYLTKGSEWQYKRFGKIAHYNGLDWGGDWKNIFDPAHVEIKHGYSMPELRALPKDVNGYITGPLVKE